MSAATTSTIVPPIVHHPHGPHTAHPIPLREHAFTLHCQGLRSPAISAELGVPERTIRAWIAAALDDLKDDLQLTRREQLLLAVERQHTITVAAWRQFEQESAARTAILDAALDTALNSADAPNADGASSCPLQRHIPSSTPAPRYLSLILQAHKETNRLLGLYTLAKLQPLTTESPDSSGSPDTGPAPLTASVLPSHPGRGAGGEVPIAAESATSRATHEIAAKTATAPTLPSSALNSLRATAESATASISPLRARREAPSAAGVRGQGSRQSASPVATERSESGGGTSANGGRRRADWAGGKLPHVPAVPQPWMM